MMFLVHLAALFNIACAQPLYDLMSRNGEFFVAHRVSPESIVLGCLLLSVGVPVGLFLSCLPVAVLGASARKWSRATLILLICGLGFVPVADRLGTPSWVTLGLATGAATLVAFSYVRSTSWRRFVTYLSPGIIAFPVLFLFASPIARLLFSPSGANPAGTGAHSDAPVFLIVFDELSTVSLMDAEGEIDERLYPNFARLADEAHWFRNATTVSHSTSLAVPATLTGRFPVRGTLPIVADHPVNLLTLMAPSHDIHAFETITDLCPSAICDVEQKRDRSAWSAARSVFLDLLVIYGHIVLPRDYRDRLPALDGRWIEFREPAEGDDISANAAKLSSAAEAGAAHWEEVKAGVRQGIRRRALFEEFVASIAEDPRGELYFVHILLPHVPYQFLPDGRYYTLGSELHGWYRDGRSPEMTLDEVLVAQAYQRYLLQLRFVDSLLGLFLDRLRALGAYDESMIVVTADHGVNFAPGQSRRGVVEETIATSLPVPLLIKEPHQRVGRLDDSNVETIDVLPTMGHVLGLALPPDLPGSSLLASAWSDRPVKRVLFHGVMEFSPNLVADMRLAVEHKAALFGKHQETLDLYDHGPLLGLVGRLTGELELRGFTAGSVKIDAEERYDQVSLRSEYFPAAFAEGTIALDGATNRLPLVAVVVNGRIAGVTRAFPSGARLKFATMLSIEALREGVNRLDVYLVDRQQGTPALIPLRRVAVVPELAAGSLPKVDRSFRLPNGKLAERTRHQVRGGANVARDEAVMSIWGWVADVHQGRPAEAVLAYEGDRLIGSQTEFRPRPGVAGLLGAEYLDTGFRFAIPWLGDGAEAGRIRVFALLQDGTVAELRVRVAGNSP